MKWTAADGELQSPRQASKPSVAESRSIGAHASRGRRRGREHSGPRAYRRPQSPGR